MLRPKAFQQRSIASRNIPYLCGAPDERDPAHGGVLHRGQAVWTKPDAVLNRNVRWEAAYVEGVGVISINPHWLKRANLVEREADSL